MSITDESGKQHWGAGVDEDENPVDVVTWALYNENGELVKEFDSLILSVGRSYVDYDTYVYTIRVDGEDGYTSSDDYVYIYAE